LREWRTLPAPSHAAKKGRHRLSVVLGFAAASNPNFIALTAQTELVRKNELFVRYNWILLGGVIMLEREEELLNSKQVAVILDMSPDTVNEFARKNILPAFKKGKQWRFRRRDISVFFKKQPKDIRDA